MTTDRRGLLAALGTSVTLSGCLKFRELQSDSSTPITGTSPETRTDSSHTPSESRLPRTISESLPDGTNWAFQARAPFQEGPRYSAGTVLATSVDRHLYALDAKSGEKRWSKDVYNKLDAGLTVVNGIVVAAGSSERIGVGISDGETRFHKTGYDTGIRAQTGIGDTVYQCRLPSGIRAINPTNGEIKWTVSNDKPAPTIDADTDTVCVSYEPEGHFGKPPWAFGGYDAETGEELWFIKRDKETDQGDGRVIVLDGVCFGFGGDGHYTTIDTRSGQILHEGQTKHLGLILGAFDGIVLLYSLYSSTFVGWDVTNAEVVWQAENDLSYPDAITQIGSTLWFVTFERLYRLSIPDGKITQVRTINLGGQSIENASYAFQSAFPPNLALTEEMVFLFTEDAKLRAIQR